MILNIPQCTGELPMTRNCPFQNITAKWRTHCCP
jgi:hypothetical protein